MKQRETILASGVSSETPIHTQATARPWETDNTAVRSEGPGGRQVALCGFSARGGQRYDDAYDEAVANAALIVKAVNRDHHFDELVKALEEISALLPIAQQSGTCITIPHVSEAVHIARAALAGAK